MKKALLKAFGVLTFVGLTKVLIDTYLFKVEKVQFKTKKLAKHSRLRILQISDVHNKKSRSLLQRVIKKVKELEPNLIVLTGDIIDRQTRDFQSILTFVDGLIITGVPIYFVSGNHEWINPRRDMFLTELSKRKITILSNEHLEITVNDQHINLVGIEDAATEHENIEKAFSRINEANYTILLSHSPYVIKKYPNMQADLVISGHTHGGQIRFPFIGAVISPGEGFFPKLDKGVFKWGNEQQLYVDSGLGTTRMPIRFLNQSQITIINISGTIRVCP